MKIRCDVCEKLEAEVLCCADEAVLCIECDVNVHGANKLSQKHQRVRLLKDTLSSSSSLPSSSSSMLPFCDICKVKKAYFFCLEDRALLCRICDVSKHGASPFLSSHQRYLIAGVKLALESFNSNAGSTSSTSPISTTDSNVNINVASSSQASGFTSGCNFALNKTEWTFEEILDASEFEYYGLSDIESTKMSSQ